MKEQEFVNDIAKKVADIGGSTYYVGGYVRDSLLGKPSKDIDIEIHGITQQQLSELLKEYGEIGEVKEIGKSFGVMRVGSYDVDISQPRREEKTGDKHTDFSIVVDPFMGTKEAAQRRDFTINALMQDVLTGEIIDHFGGIKDIEEHRLRHVNDKTFKEDPLRVLRGAQFAARFEFDIAPETKKIMAELSLNELPKERVNDELKKAMTKSDKPSVFFDVLKETNQLDVWFPEVKALIDSPQSKIFHPEGDVYTHTMIVIDNLAKHRDETNEPYALMLSGLCHDFGKPLTTTWNEKKQVYQNIGHGKAGLEPAERFMDRVVNNTRLKEYVLEVVEKHDMPVQMYDSQVKNIKTNVFYDELKYPEDIILVTCADRMNITEAEIDKYRSWLTERLDEYKDVMSRPEVMGRDLVEMGLEPSPVFSKILEDAHSRHLRYEDKDAVLKSIRKQYGLEKEEDKTLSADSFVKKAFTNANRIPSGDGTYQEAMIAQRVAGEKNAGSSYEVSANELRQAIFKAKWTETTHPSVAPGCRVFVTEDMPQGKNGIADIRNLPDDTVFYAMDPKGTGNISIGTAMGDNQPVETKTYLITGKEDIKGKSEDVVYTFHPGEPVSPSIITTDTLKEGTKLTKEEALSFGFDKCKFMSDEMVQAYESKQIHVPIEHTAKDNCAEVVANEKLKPEEIDFVAEKTCFDSTLNYLNELSKELDKADEKDRNQKDVDKELDIDEEYER